MSNTNIVLYKQYATYQACLDVYSNKIKNNDVFKKTFLYIVNWLQARVGDEYLKLFPDLAIYPNVSEYVDFDLSQMYGVTIKSQLDIRLFRLEKENAWTMRIEEPDNRAEFKNNNLNDGSEISGRSFVTEIGLHENEKSVTLAIQIICKEPLSNTRDAISFRPAFVKQILQDESLEIVEANVDKEYRVNKSFDEEGKITVEPFFVDNKNGKRFMEKMFLNPNRQLPIIICPESVRAVTYKDSMDIKGELKEFDRDINSITKSLVGYAHVVIISDDVRESLFERENCNCGEYGEELLEDCVIFHSKLEAETFLPDGPIYCSLTDKEDKPDEEENDGLPALKIMEMQAKRYSVRRQFSFAPAAFYRELKKKYYAYEGLNDTKEAVKNLEHDIQEKDAMILGLNSKLAQDEREHKKRVDALKSKFDNSQAQLATYLEKYRETQNELDIIKQDENRVKKEYEEKIRQKDLQIAALTKEKIVDPDGERLKKMYAAEQCVLFDCRDDNKKDGLLKFIRAKLKDVLQQIYKGISPEFRRHELLEILIQYNNYLVENGMAGDALLYYPSGFEFYEGEYKDVIYDAVYSALDKAEEFDEFLVDLLDYNDFDYAQEEKKEELMQKINSYRNVSKIKGIIEKTGFVLKASGTHYIYKYYDDERYKITVASSPSDTNSGKNLVDRIIELCL